VNSLVLQAGVRPEKGLSGHPLLCTFVLYHLVGDTLNIANGEC
jgi:hypothetical protein